MSLRSCTDRAWSVQKPIFFQNNLEQAWLISNLLHNWKCYKEIFRFVDWKNIANSKLAILIGGRLGIIFIVTFDAEQNRRARKLCLRKSQFIQRQKTQNHQKIFKSDLCGIIWHIAQPNI